MGVGGREPKDCAIITPVMIVGTHNIEPDSTIKSDVCIVGCGVAGLSLARELAGGFERVCVLETGGFRFRPRPQTFAFGFNTGNPYFALGVSRIFRFGGTSNRWCSDLGDGSTGVRLRPLDPIDFEQRDAVPHSGWPFDYLHLAPFYSRAQAHFGLEERDYEFASWKAITPHGPLPLDPACVNSVIFQFCETRQYIQRARTFIDHSNNIQLYPNTRVLDIELSQASQAIQHIRARTLAGKSIKVQAKQFILACGGIENPRMLLNANRQQGAGIGNQHDLVGRFFMEHPHLLSGTVIPASPDVFNRIGLYSTHPVDTTHIMGKLALNNDRVRSEALLNSCMFFEPRSTLKPKRPVKIYNTKGAESLLSILGDIENRRLPSNLLKHSARVCGELPRLAAFAVDKLTSHRRQKEPTALGVYNFLEQAPNPASRITLTTEKDFFDQPRVQLDWRLCRHDIDSMLKSQEIIGQELLRAGIGTLISEPYSDISPDNIIGGYHHMGTTRMHTDPKQGVVDADCKVHNIHNLFIAGSSVFPTCGYANPTLTIVALAIRLADHLKRLSN